MAKTNLQALIITSLFFGGLLVIAGKKSIGKNRSKLSDTEKKKFIQKIRPYALAIGKAKGVPPDFILAQLALESNYGQSSLAKNYFNYGGIKAKKGQPFVQLLTTECKGNLCKKVYQNFARFNSLPEGMKAQASIYSNPFFRKYQNQTKNAIIYAHLIQSGPIKYATAKNYPKAIENTLKEVKRLEMA